MDQKKEVLPGHETQSNEMNCPSCGRFVGAKTKCPYCGANVEKRMSLRLVRSAAVLLATIGLFLLYLMAKHSDVPLVKIGDIEPTMNFGQVKLLGEVLSDPRVYAHGGAGFRLADGTGEVMVFMSAKQIEQLQALDRYPRAGDILEVMGGLSYDENRGASLRLQNPDGVTIERKPVPALPLSDIDASLKGASVMIEGKVLDLKPPAPGTKQPYSMRVEDASGAKSIVFWESDYDRIEGKDVLNGAYIRARVTIDTYKGDAQIKLSSGDELTILDEAPPAVTGQKTPAVEKKPRAKSDGKAKTQSRDFSRGRKVTPNSIGVADVTSELEGKTIRVRGRVDSVREPEAGTKQPYSVILRDGDATLRVTYWSKVNDVIDVKPTPGVVFEMEGEVEVYQGKPQLKVKSGFTVKMVSDLPASQPTVDSSKVIKIESITVADVGEAKVISGLVGEDKALKGGVAYEITDDTGSIDLVMWEGRTPIEIREAIQEGLSVLASGKVNEYQGELNLVADSGYSVQILN